MSVVTNVVLLAGCDIAETQLIQINEFFGEDVQGFVSADDPSLPRGWYGGSKMLECRVAIGAFNYLNLDGLIEHIRTKVKWSIYHCHAVQLAVREDQKFSFRLIEVLPSRA